MGCPQRGSWPGIGIHCPVSRAARGSGPMSGCGSQEHSGAAAEARELRVKGGSCQGLGLGSVGYVSGEGGLGQKCLRDEVLALRQHGSRPSKRPSRRPASAAACFSTRALLGTREATPFREATAPLVKLVKGDVIPECTCTCTSTCNCICACALACIFFVCSQ